MKEISRKLFFLFMIIATLFAAIYFTNRAWKAFRNYQIVQSSDIYIGLADQLNNLARKLEEERALTALYLGTKGNLVFRKIVEKREQSDDAVIQLQRYLSKHPKLSPLKNRFSNLHEDLRYVRSRVDVINDDYHNILFVYYQNKIISPLLEEMRTWIQKLGQSIHSVHPYFITYNELVTLRNTLNHEQSYITYILARNQKMTMQDLGYWEEILKKEQLPLLERLNGKPIYQMIQKIFHKDRLTQTAASIRRTMLRGSANGHYAMDTKIAIRQMQQNVDFVSKTEKTLFDYLKSLDFKAIIPVSLYTNLAAILSALVTLFYLIRIFKRSRSFTKLQKETENPDIQIKHHFEKGSSTKNRHNPLYPDTLALPQEIVTDSEDLPLTNIAPLQQDRSVQEEEEIVEKPQATPKEEERSILESTFSPIRSMKELIKPYIQIAQRHNISFHYSIDPSLPDICIGDPEKIKQILKLFLDSAMETGNARKEVILRIENVAQKKFETALSITIKDSGKYISDEERRKIRRGSSKSANPLSETFASHNRDFIKAGQLIKRLDGNLQIQSDQKEGTEFIISLNLKRFISTEN
ncbi:MAG: hypothetical protein DSZ05_06360 [Sulfurospirillum sp.]|nr:MAG: hypothetical protein DSZ05_06360 [Sulfurospirillum sp.]